VPEMGVTASLEGVALEGLFSPSLASAPLWRALHAPGDGCGLDRAAMSLEIDTEVASSHSAATTAHHNDPKDMSPHVSFGETHTSIMAPSTPPSTRKSTYRPETCLVPCACWDP